MNSLKMQNFKNNTNELMYKREADSQIGIKFMVTKGEDINQAYDINRYKLLYIKQISNKDLLYNIRKYIQYFTVTCNGK